jgi:hypothetical protein
MGAKLRAFAVVQPIVSMSRLRRYLVPTLLLLPVVLLAAKLLVTPVSAMIDTQGTKIQSFLLSGPFSNTKLSGHERGWPWIFSQKFDGTSAIPGLYDVYFSWPVLLGDIAILLGALVLMGMLFVWIWRRCGCRPQISLRGLLITTALIGCMLGWWMAFYGRWKRESQILETLAAHRILCGDHQRACPEWLRRLISEDAPEIFTYPRSLVVRVEAPADYMAQLESALPNLPNISSLTIGLPMPLRASNPSAFSRIAEVVVADNTVVDDEEAISLLLKMPNLKSLKLPGGLSPISKERMRRLKSHIDEVTIQVFP